VYLNRRNFAALSLGAIAANAAWPLPTTRANHEDPRPRPTAPDFQWGVSTSAYQTEGGSNNTDLWLLEHFKDSIFRDKSGDACDHYHRLKDDIQLIASLGFNSYRFSVEWARIEPEEGEFSNAQLAHYYRVAEACRAAGLAPHVTLHHFTSPLWFARSGGWGQTDAAALFARYCGKVADRLGNLISAACTINEINIPAILQRRHYLRDSARHAIQSAVAQDIVTPHFSSLLTDDPQILQHRLLEAHMRARDTFKHAAPNVPLGLNIAIADDQAVDGGEAKTLEFRALCYDSYLETAREDDFVAVQTYTRNLVGPEGDRQPGLSARRTQNGWEFYPEALEHTIRYAAQRCNKPILITENGIATANDEERIEYIQTAIKGLFRCIADGINVKGYYHWSALDNFEFMEGYGPKFGLIAVDRVNFARTVKPSARFLGSIAKSGSFNA
jgi:beta-glucosidase